METGNDYRFGRMWQTRVRVVEMFRNSAVSTMYSVKMSMTSIVVLRTFLHNVVRQLLSNTLHVLLSRPVVMFYSFIVMALYSYMTCVKISGFMNKFFGMLASLSQSRITSMV